MIKEFLFGISSALAETTGAAAAGTAADGAAVAAEEMAMSPVAAILQLVLPLVLMGAVFYFMLIRPQRKKDKKVKEMLAALKVGDRVCTIGGIYGTIASIKDETITLYVGAQKTQLVVARWAIRSVEDAPLVENESEALV